MKTCGTMDESRLNDYIDGHLDATARDEVERHLHVCADCPGILEDLRAIRSAAASLPRAIETPRDLWSEIEGRIEESPADSMTSTGSNPVIEPGASTGSVTPAGPARFRLARTWHLGLAAAAAMVLLVAGGVFLTRDGRRPADGEATPPPGASITLASLQAAGADYRRLTTEIEALIEERRDDLSPVTVSILEENLKIIDAAFEEIQAALVNDPQSAPHRALFTSIYRRKMMLLQQASTLPPRS